MGVRNFCWPVLLFYRSNYIEFKSKSKIFWTLSFPKFLIGFFFFFSVFILVFCLNKKNGKMAFVNQ